MIEQFEKIKIYKSINKGLISLYREESAAHDYADCWIAKTKTALMSEIMNYVDYDFSWRIRNGKSESIRTNCHVMDEDTVIYIRLNGEFIDLTEKETFSLNLIKQAEQVYASSSFGFIVYSANFDDIVIYQEYDDNQIRLENEGLSELYECYRFNLNDIPDISEYKKEQAAETEQAEQAAETEQAEQAAETEQAENNYFQGLTKHEFYKKYALYLFKFSDDINNSRDIIIKLSNEGISIDNDILTAIDEAYNEVYSAKFNVIRLWDSNDIRKMCIKENFYSCGDNEDYETLLNYISENKPTFKNIYYVAMNIGDHSKYQDNDEGYDGFIRNIMYIIENTVVKTCFINNNELDYYSARNNVEIIK